jgi:hypothetical protein
MESTAWESVKDLVEADARAIRVDHASSRQALGFALTLAICVACAACALAGLARTGDISWAQAGLAFGAVWVGAPLLGACALILRSRLHPE